MKSGFCKSKIISINPDIYWLEQELSIQEEPEYIWTDRDGVRNCKIDIYFEDNQNNVFKSEIYLKDKLKQGKSDNFCYVNQVGDNQWVTNENQLFDNFKNWVQVVSWGINGEKIEKYRTGAIPFEKQNIAKKDYHIAIEGEDVLLQFLKQFYNYSNYDTDANVFIDLNKLFEGDFSTLQRIIRDEKDFHLVIFTYLSKKLEQKVLNYFFPLEFFRDVLNNFQISQKFKNQYKDFNKKLEFIEGYWEIGKIKDFKPEIKNVLPEDSDY